MSKQIYLVLVLLVNLSFGQDSTSIKVIARSLPDQVLLRWAVSEPFEWKMANEYGFWIERVTLIRDGETLAPMERKQLNSQPLKPKPLEEWEQSAINDQNAAILAQALYGSSFETTAPSGQLGTIIAINDELEQRFTFALLAAEQNFEAAKLAGWGFTDKNVSKGEKYVYIITVALPQETTLAIKKGTVYASPDFYEPLPKPIGFTGAFGDGHVTLNWNFNLLESLYSNYTVEKSSNNIDFEPLNESPIFQVEQTKSNQQSSMYYTDSIPNNIKFWYRIKGTTAFGEQGPSSGVLTGSGEKQLGFVPRIYKKQLPTDKKVDIYWEFDEQGNSLIDGFELRRSLTNNGYYETVVRDIPSAQRNISHEGLFRSNYYTIVAMGKNGLESESFPVLVQPVDSIPPNPPMGLNSVVDTTGLLTLTWNKNTEEDLRGYRIYRSTDKHIEFSELTKMVQEEIFYIDTLDMSSLNKKVYYQIIAEDYRYNKSQFSKILEVTPPDFIPPSPPVLTSYKVEDDGIRINWIPSSSTDISNYRIFRKSQDRNQDKWEQLNESSKTDTTFLDNTDLRRNTYDYTIIAIDSSGLESTPVMPLRVIWNGNSTEENDLKFSGTVNRELRFINLSWKVKSKVVLEYRLYKGKNNKTLKRYKTFSESQQSFNDVSLEVNTTYSYGIQVVYAGGITSSIKKIDIKY